MKGDTKHEARSMRWDWGVHDEHVACRVHVSLHLTSCTCIHHRCNCTRKYDKVSRWVTLKVDTCMYKLSSWYYLFIGRWCTQDATHTSSTSASHANPIARHSRPGRCTRQQHFAKLVHASSEWREAQLRERGRGPGENWMCSWRRQPKWQARFRCTMTMPLIYGETDMGLRKQDWKPVRAACSRE